MLLLLLLKEFQQHERFEEQQNYTSMDRHSHRRVHAVGHRLMMQAHVLLRRSAMLLGSSSIFNWTPHP